MTGTLIDLDKQLFLALNHFATPAMDPVMRLLSGLVPWALFIIGFLLVIGMKNYRNHRRLFYLSILITILVYTTTEVTSVHLFKEVFMRLRPCHEPSLNGQVRLAALGCGGQYGFVSSHAANSFGLAMISSLLIRRKWFTICVFSGAFLVSYSRIYVGVHYPGDVAGGMILGLAVAMAWYLISRSLLLREDMRTRGREEIST